MLCVIIEGSIKPTECGVSQDSSHLFFNGMFFSLLSFKVKNLLLFFHKDVWKCVQTAMVERV